MKMNGRWYNFSLITCYLYEFCVNVVFFIMHVIEGEIEQMEYDLFVSSQLYISDCDQNLNFDNYYYAH